MRFIRYQHIEKWGHPAVEGINKGKVNIFPKLDGQCVSVFMDGERLAIGGRRCEEDRQKSPHIFRHFDNNIEKYEAFFRDYPDLVLYGEYGNKTTIGYYQQEVYGDFFVFDVVKYDESDTPTYLTYDEYANMLINYQIKYIPCIGLTHDLKEEEFELFIDLATNYFVDKTKANGKRAEGIVIKNYDYRNKYGKQIWAKVVTEEYTKKKLKLKNDGSIDDRTCEQMLVEETFTESFFKKEFQKFREAHGEVTKKHIPILFETLFETWITEEVLTMFRLMRKHKKPTFDPALLDREMKRVVKGYVPELFVK